MYPVMLPGDPHDNDGFSSFRNPDGFLPERRGAPPDPIGRGYIRLLELIADWWDSFRRLRSSRSVQPNEQAEAVPHPQS